MWGKAYSEDWLILRRHGKTSVVKLALKDAVTLNTFEKAHSTYQDDVTTLQEELRLTNIQRRWVLQLATAVFRWSSGSVPSSLVGKLSIARHAHHTRGNQPDIQPFPPTY